MIVAYPRKLRNGMGAREILAQVVRDREIHLITKELGLKPRPFRTALILFIVC